jgi:hypothetical protein
MTVYVKTAWVTSTAPGISAGNLNNLESQYDCFISSYSTNTPLPDSTTPTTGTSSYWSMGDHIHQVAEYFQKTVASNSIKITDTSTSNSVIAGLTVMKTITLPPHIVSGGTIRVNFDSYTNSTTANRVYAYAGGAVSGSPFYPGTSYFTTTTDLTYTQGTIYIYGNCIVGGYTLYVTNVQIGANTTASIPSTW